MGKVVNITEKLDFDSNPKIKIKDEEYEVNTDAETVLKIMGALGNNQSVTPKEIVQMYELIFSEKEREKIAKLKLQFKDFKKVVEESIELIIDDDEKQGE